MPQIFQFSIDKHLFTLRKFFMSPVTGPQPSWPIIAQEFERKIMQPLLRFFSFYSTTSCCLLLNKTFLNQILSDEQMAISTSEIFKKAYNVTYKELNKYSIYSLKEKVF